MIKFNLSFSDIVFSLLLIIFLTVGIVIGYNLGVSVPQNVTNYDVKNKKGELNLIPPDTIKTEKPKFFKRLFK